MKDLYLVFIILAALIILYVVIELVEHKHVSYVTKTLTDYNGLKLCILCDLHNNHLPKSAIKRIREEKPSCIIIAGDLINQKNIDVSHTVSLVYELSKIAQVYYCYGNHEQKNELYNPLQWENFKASVSSMVEFVEDHVSISETCELYGIRLSCDLYKNAKQSGKVPLTEENLKEFPEKLISSKYTVVVCHTPAYAGLLKDRLAPDLIISGHLHGGHIRLPFIGGILYTIHPKPKYTAGLYDLDSTKLYVSRGTGTHFIPCRFLNRAEITFIRI